MTAEETGTREKSNWERIVKTMRRKESETSGVRERDMKERRESTEDSDGMV